MSSTKTRVIITVQAITFHCLSLCVCVCVCVCVCFPPPFGTLPSNGRPQQAVEAKAVARGAGLLKVLGPGAPTTGAAVLALLQHGLRQQCPAVAAAAAAAGRPKTITGYFQAAPRGPSPESGGGPNGLTAEPTAPLYSCNSHMKNPAAATVSAR